MLPLLANLVLVLLCFPAAHLTESGGEECVIELECEECLPEYMPAVRSHAARRGVVRVRAGDDVALACSRGHFLAFPRAELAARCEAGRFRVGDRLLPLLELGCQQDVLEDVQHAVEHCAPPLQGHAYETQEAARTRHLATLCYDAERAVPVRLRTTNSLHGVPLAAHSDARAPLSLLGNFNQMFDASTRRAAERLFADEARLHRRLLELLKHERYSLGAQRPAPARLLAPAYFEPADVRAADLASNKFVSWRSVVEGNLRHMHEDVAAYMAARRPAAVEVYAGTHGVLAVGAGAARRELFFKEGRRFPVPRYVWTALLEPARAEGVALVLLNDPFVTVSEIREAVFCESACGRVPALAALTRHRNYERPLLGLVFCCQLAEFAAHVPEMPRVFNETFKLLQ